MRVIVMFDLPMETAKDRYAYARFRKDLIKEGFIMMQESVYCKLVLNPLAGDLVKEKVRKNRPPKGIIQAMIITEKQYADIEYLLGGPQTEKIDGTDRLVIF
ncbi:MAG: CRISPR-associated endonuclease Cas2 [Clostridia bacterium]|nr:CRISPR-associated endonuclease Cas2 [Clostridia bacterium]